MGEIAVRCLCVGFTAWGIYFLLLDGSIANTVVKNIFSSTGEWICNLFRQSSSQNNNAEPFVVSEYLTQIEKASVEILESRKPVEQIVILWWGLDGLRLNEDGTTEWISRKKSEPVSTGVLYQPCRSITPTPQYDMCQSTQAQIDALMTQNIQLQVQSWQAEQNRQMINALQSYVVQWPGYYARLTDCCCNQTRDRF